MGMYYSNLVKNIKENKKILEHISVIEAPNSTKEIYKEYTYKELVDFAEGISNTLINSNCSIVGLVLPNCFEFVASYLGVLISDKFLVSISPDMFLENKNELIEEYNIDTIITTKSFIADIDYTKSSQLSNSSAFIFNINESTKDNDIRKYGSILSFTSGTSGKSKGVVINDTNIEYVSNQYKKIYKLSSTSKILSILPYWHNYGMFACVAAALHSKSIIVCLEEWNYKIAMESISKYKIDIFPGSPYMYQSIVKNYSGEYDIKSLSVCDSGGDMLPLQYLHKFEEITGTIITEGYGLTETTSLTHFNLSTDKRVAGSIGQALSRIECSIRDEDTEEEVKSGYGILWIKGPAVARYYYFNNRIVPTCKDGWFNTKDVAWRDSNSNYYIIGRYSDINKINLEVFPREIEEYLYSKKGISRVCVTVSFNSEEQIPKYNISIMSNEKISEIDMKNFIIDKFKQIKINKLEIFERLELTHTKKVKRNY